MKIKCIAVDDEPLALEKVVDYIGQVPFFELKGSFSNALEALNFLQDNEVDLLFLDIQMPQLLGTQLLQILNNKPQVIFTTAYSEYAVEGFELAITDYLLKPISFGRFLQAAQRALSRVNANAPKRTTTPEVTPQYLFIKTETRLQKVVLEDVLYIEGLKDYLSIYTKQERILTLMSFNELLEKLPAEFVRVHRSYVVPISKVESVEKSRLTISEKKIPIGETYRKHFLSFLS